MQLNNLLKYTVNLPFFKIFQYISIIHLTIRLLVISNFYLFIFPGITIHSYSDLILNHKSFKENIKMYNMSK